MNPAADAEEVDAEDVDADVNAEELDADVGVKTDVDANAEAYDAESNAEDAEANAEDAEANTDAELNSPNAGNTESIGTGQSECLPDS